MSECMPLKPASSGGLFKLPTIAERLIQGFPPEWKEGLNRTAEVVGQLGTWLSDNSDQILRVVASLGVPLEELRTHQLGQFALVNRELVETLIGRGWYPDPQMAPMQVAYLATEYETQPEGVVKVFVTVFRERFDDIEAQLIAAFPNRSGILGNSFDAHRRGAFDLSILGFLTQADGIWRDHQDRHLFDGGTDEAVQDLAAQIVDPNVRELVLALALDDWPLRLSSKQRPEGFKELNRHQVLHGEVTDYGTEENSLKAVAFLNYCAFMLSEAEDSGAAATR